MSKGHARRPCQIPREEESLRWLLAYHKITFKTFERRMKKIRKDK